MSTTIVVLSRYADIFDQFRKSAEAHEPTTPKILVRDGAEIQERDLTDWIIAKGQEPFGFARNANVGIELAAQNDVLLCNDDVSFLGPTIEQLEDLAGHIPRAGIISPMIDGFVKSPFQRGDRDPGVASVEPNMAFACVWLRRAMIEAIGGLDERFSCSYEDDDYCLQAVRAGWAPVVTNTVTVRHGFGGETASTSINRRYGGYDAILAENGRLFREKWGG